MATQPFGLALALCMALGLPWAIIGHLRGRDLVRELGSLARPAWLGLACALLFGSWIYKIWVLVG